MPVYAYRCEQCGERSYQMRTIVGRDDDRRCSTCQGAFKRLPDFGGLVGTRSQDQDQRVQQEERAPKYAADTSDSGSKDIVYLGNAFHGGPIRIQDGLAHGAEVSFNWVFDTPHAIVSEGNTPITARRNRHYTGRKDSTPSDG